MWFALEDGEAYSRQGKYGLALKRFHSVWKVSPYLRMKANKQHFDDWEEDQYDFHSYSFRKGPIRDYIKLLQWEEKLRSHPYFIRAANNAISIYVKLYDDPNLATRKSEHDGTNAEKRKAAKKAKKAAKKQEEQNTQNSTTDAKDGKVKDEDPNGDKLVKTEKPLEDSLKFLKPLQELAAGLLETQILAFDVHFRRGLRSLLGSLLTAEKYFLALAALNAANKIAKGDKEVVNRIAILKKKLVNVEMRDDLKGVMQSALSKLEVLQNGI
jgi:N-alpha-acetyltransferase 15/16, NatA auxiliary subunit